MESSSEPESDSTTSEPETESSSTESVTQSTTTSNSSSASTDYTGCNDGCMGSVTSSGMAMITLLGLGTIVFIRKKR